MSISFSRFRHFSSSTSLNGLSLHNLPIFSPSGTIYNLMVSHSLEGCFCSFKFLLFIYFYVFERQKDRQKWRALTLCKCLQWLGLSQGWRWEAVTQYVAHMSVAEIPLLEPLPASQGLSYQEAGVRVRARNCTQALGWKMWASWSGTYLLGSSYFFWGNGVISKDLSSSSEGLLTQLCCWGPQLYF